MRRARRYAELARREAEIEDARPFLDLAREIRDEVSRIAAANGDSAATADHLVEAVDAIPRRERAAVARAVFDRLSPEQQWAVLEKAWGDAEIREYLEAERTGRLDVLRRTERRRRVVAAARAARRLDTRDVPADEPLTLGLFVERDVAAAVPRGHRSTACARRLTLRPRSGSDPDSEPGTFLVIEDVFNPTGGYFVTGRYDGETWRDLDRLPPHAVVRAGTLLSDTFEPVLYIGGRADFEREGEPFEGRLHLGYALVGDEDVFAEGGKSP